MTTDRTKLMDKIRALLSKTVDNGCTEHEALAALDKARAMMDAYEVTADDLKVTAEIAAILHRDPDARDPHGIKRYLAVAVARFCDCKVWRGHDKVVVFCGLPADTELAGWLLNTLTAFVQGELVTHLMGSFAPSGERRLMIDSFVGGATSRISARLNALCKQSEAAASSNGTALVLVKGTAIADAMEAAGIKLRKSRASSRRTNNDSYAAGKAAGERASFGRPVSGGAATRITCG